MFPITIYGSQFILWHIENFVSVALCDWWRMRNAPDIPKPHTLVSLPGCLPAAGCVREFMCSPAALGPFISVAAAATACKCAET